MKKALLSVAAIIATAGFSTALAADIPVYEPPPVVAPVPPEFTWTGLYLGAQGGWKWGDNDIVVLDEEGDPLVLGDDDNPNSFDLEGAAAGGFGGVNFQWSALVLGIEADAEVTNTEGRLQSVDPDTDESFTETHIDWQASVRGRLGLAFDRFMIYGTGGVAFAEFESTFVAIPPGVSEFDSSTEIGWTAGGGIQWAVTDMLFVRGEYRFTDYGDREHTFFIPGIGDVTVEQETSLHAVRVGAGVQF